MHRSLSRAFRFQSRKRLAVFEVDGDLQLCWAAVEIENANRFMTLQIASALIRQETIGNEPHLRTEGFLRHMHLLWASCESTKFSPRWNALGKLPGGRSFTVCGKTLDGCHPGSVRCHLERSEGSRSDILMNNARFFIRHAQDRQRLLGMTARTIFPQSLQPRPSVPSGQKLLIKFCRLIFSAGPIMRPPVRGSTKFLPARKTRR